MRHTNKEASPPTQLVTEVPVPVKTTIKVMKSVVKNPSAKVKTKKTLSKDPSKSKDGIVNPTPSLPVSLTLEAGMSISDPNSKVNFCKIVFFGKITRLGEGFEEKLAYQGGKESSEAFVKNVRLIFQPY